MTPLLQHAYWLKMIAALSILSMIIGNSVAIAQRDLKRMSDRGPHPSPRGAAVDGACARHGAAIEQCWGMFPHRTGLRSMMCYYTSERSVDWHGRHIRTSSIARLVGR